MLSILEMNSSDFKTLFFDSVDFISKAEKKLNEFRYLPEGWHYGQGVPIDTSVYDRAISLQKFISFIGFTATDSFPGVDGDVMLTVYRGDHYIEISIEKNLSITLIHEKNDKEIICKPDLDIDKAKYLLLEIARSIWNISALFTPSTTTGRKGDSPALPLKIQAAEGFQSLIGAVSGTQELQSAITFDDTIHHQYQVNPQCTGSLMKRYYLPDTG